MVLCATAIAAAAEEETADLADHVKAVWKGKTVLYSCEGIDADIVMRFSGAPRRTEHYAPAEEELKVLQRRLYRERHERDPARNVGRTMYKRMNEAWRVGASAIPLTHRIRTREVPQLSGVTYQTGEEGLFACTLSRLGDPLDPAEVERSLRRAMGRRPDVVT
eukprot:gene19082-36560_t